jgi:hypothetical protein
LWLKTLLSCFIAAFALRPKVEQELDKLEKQNILTPVQVSDWASPVVPVLKKDGRGSEFVAILK